MTAPRIEPGTLCIVVRSYGGNNGATVEAIRWVPAMQVVPECSLSLSLQINHAWAGWLCKASRPLKRHPANPAHRLENELYGVFSPDQLMPITPPPGTDTEHTATPADAVPA